MARRERKSARAAFVLALLLAGCAPHEMTASEATEVANAEVNRLFPQFDQSGRTIRAEDSDGNWSVHYESADDLTSGGPVIVRVNKRSRQAAVVQSPQ